MSVSELKGVALGDELLLEAVVIFDDAVVDDGDFAGLVEVRMGIFVRGRAVRGPARVADAEDAGGGFRRRSAARPSSMLPFFLRTCSRAVVQDGNARRCRSRDIPAAAILPAGWARPSFFPTYPMMPHIRAARRCAKFGQIQARNEREFEENSLMNNVVVVDHPLVRHNLASLRDKNTQHLNFRRLLGEISLLMSYEIARSFETREVKIQTPLETTAGTQLDARRGVDSGAAGRPGHAGSDS